MKSFIFSLTTGIELSDRLMALTGEPPLRILRLAEYSLRSSDK